MKGRIRENGIDYVMVGGCYIPDLSCQRKKDVLGNMGVCTVNI